MWCRSRGRIEALGKIAFPCTEPVVEFLLALIWLGARPIGAGETPGNVAGNEGELACFIKI